MLAIPELSTPRLRLVAPAEAHLDAFFTMYVDEETTRYIPHTRTASRVAAWFKIATQLGHWQLRGCGFWTVIERETDEVVGNVGLLFPVDNPALEVGWLIARPHWGMGYAHEAAQAALQFAFEVRGTTQVMARLSSHNAASFALAKKLGLQVDEHQSADDELVMRINRPLA